MGLVTGRAFVIVYNLRFDYKHTYNINKHEQPKQTHKQNKR